MRFLSLNFLICTGEILPQLWNLLTVGAADYSAQHCDWMHLESEFVDNALMSESDVMEDRSSSGANVEVELPVEPADTSSRHTEAPSVRRITSTLSLPPLTPPPRVCCTFTTRVDVIAADCRWSSGWRCSKPRRQTDQQNNNYLPQFLVPSFSWWHLGVASAITALWHGRQSIITSTSLSASCIVHLSPSSIIWRNQKAVVVWHWRL